MAKLPPETRIKILQKGHENITEQAKQKHIEFEQFMQNPSVEEFVNFCDSDKRWQNFRRVAKQFKPLNELGIGDYVTDILQKRNCLAHGIPEAHADGGHLFRHGKHEYHFNDDTSLNLRHLIREYKAKFQEAIQIAHGLPSL